MRIFQNAPAVLVTSLLLAGGAVIVWKAVAPAEDTADITVTVPALSTPAIEGKQAFDANCADCHGENGTGTDTGPPLVHDIYNPGHHNDLSFFAAARQGVGQHHWRFGDMPPQPQVKDDQMAVIVRYIRELQQANGIFYRQHKM